MNTIAATKTNDLVIIFSLVANVKFCIEARKNKFCRFLGLFNYNLKMVKAKLRTTFQKASNDITKMIKNMKISGTSLPVQNFIRL